MLWAGEVSVDTKVLDFMVLKVGCNMGIDKPDTS